MSSSSRKSGSRDSGKSKADLLIEEAVRAVEAREVEYEGEVATSDEVIPAENNRTSGPIAKIEVQKVVDKEAYLRLAAEYENFRKRAVKDRQDAERGGREKILRGFLEILDNLERGLAQAANENSPLAQGLQMILSQTDMWLKAEGLERVESVGKIFDPTLHEAMGQRNDPNVEDGLVIEELKRGYRWTDRLIRPATVVVCKKEA